MIYDNTDNNSRFAGMYQIVKLILRSGKIYFNKKEFQSPQCDYNCSFPLIANIQTFAPCSYRVY